MSRLATIRFAVHMPTCRRGCALLGLALVLGRCTVDGVCWDNGPLSTRAEGGGKGDGEGKRETLEGGGMLPGDIFYVNVAGNCDGRYCWSGFLIEVSTGNWASAGDQNCSYFDADPSLCETYTWLDEIPAGYRCCAYGGGSETAPPPPLPPIAPYPPASCATFRLIKPAGHRRSPQWRSCLAVP